MEMPIDGIGTYLPGTSIQNNDGVYFGDNSNSIPDLFSVANSSGYLAALEEKAKRTGAEADFEKWLDARAQEDYLSRAYAYDEYIRGSQYQRMAADLKKAGLNPYLALNSLSGGSGSSIQGQTIDYNATSSQATKLTAQSNMVKAIALMLTGFFAGAGNIIKAAAGFNS